MEDLSMAIKAMFSQMEGDEILKALNLSCYTPVTHLDAECGESVIMKLLMREDNNNYSLDQLSMIGQIINKKWMVADNDCLYIFTKEILSSTCSCILYLRHCL